MAFGDEFSMNRSAYLALMAGDAYKKINDFQVPSISNQTITDLGDTSMVASTLATQGDFIGRQTLQSNQSTGTSTMADNTPDATTDSNWWDKITNFFNAIGNSINEGILDFADSIGDAAIKIGSWFTPDDTWAENAIKTDWQAPVLKALDSYSTMSNPLNWINAAVKGENASDYWNSLWGGDWTPSGARQSLNEKKYDTFLSNGAMDVATGIGNAVGQIAPNVALAVATGGATVPAQMAIQGGLGVVQGLGSGAETAVNEGASMNQASLYGAIQGGIGGIVSAVSAGIGGTLSKGGQGAIGAASKKTGNWFIGKVGGKIADASSRKTAEVLMGKTTEVLLDAGFDGASTFIQSSLDPVFKQITYDQNALEKAYGSSDAIKNTFAQAGIAAAISFAASGIVGAAREGYSYIKDGKENYQNLYFDQKTLAYMNKTERKALQGAIDDYNNKIKPLQDTLDGLSARQFTAGDDAGNAELTSLRYQTLDKLDKATREYNEKYANTLNAALDGIHKVSNTGDSSNLEKAIRYQNDRVAKITGDIDNFRGFVKYYMDNESKGKTPRLYGPDESAFTLNDGSQYPQIPSSSAPTSLPSPTGGLPLLPSEGGNALAMPRLTYKSTLVQGRNVDLAIGASSIDNLTPVLKPKSEAAVFESLNFTETHKNSIAPKQVEFDAKAIDPSLEGTIIAKPIESKTHDTAIDLQSVSDNGEEKSWRGKLFPADDWQGQYYFSVNSDDVMYIDKYRSRRTATMEEIKAKSRSFNEFLKEQKIKSLSKTSPEEIAQRKGKESSNEYKDENSKFLDFKGTIDGKTQKFRIKAGNEKIFILDTDGKWVDSKLTLDQLNDISRGFSKIYVNIKDKSVDGVFSFIKEKRLKKKSKESVVQKRKLSINSTEKERIEALKGKKLKMISLKGEAFQESTIKKGKSKWRSESLKFLKESVDLEKIKNEEYLIGDTGLRGKLSSKSIGESIENSKSLGALKIALAHLKEVLTNSIEIEEHLREGYKGKNDKNLKAYIELVSIIDTKNYLLPIKIGVKDFGISNDRNVIYTVTALTPIHKKGWGLEGRNSSSSLTPAHPSNIILEDLIEKVKDQELLKYFPYGYRMNRQNVLFGILLDLIMCLRRFPLGWQEGNRENPGTQKAPTYLRRHQRMGLIIPRAVQDIPYCPGTPA